MKVTVWQRLDVFAKTLTPFVITLALLVINVLPTHIPGASFFVPALGLMSIYYWGMHRADLLPAPGVFVIGLIQDALTGMPIGLNAFIFLVVYGICVTQRRIFYGQSFLVVWWGFAIIAAGAFIVAWLLMSLFTTTIIQPRPALFQFLMTVLFYPPLTLFFVYVQRSLPKQD